MPQFERPLRISSMDKYPSIGSLWVEVGVVEFINACSDEEFYQLVDEIRKIDAQNAIINPITPTNGFKVLTEEEVKEMGLDTQVEDNKVKKMPRKNIKRTNKKSDNDEQE